MAAAAVAACSTCRPHTTTALAAALTDSIAVAAAARSWDNVEELSAAAAHKKVAFKEDPVSNDPLEQFCE